MCRRFSAALVVDRLTCRSQRRCFRKDSVSSVDSMFLRVVRGDNAGGCTLEVVMIMGRAREAGASPWARFGGSACGGFWGDEPSGPLGDVVRDRRMAGVEREAAFCKANARSFSCIKLVKRDRLETRFGFESSTRLKVGSCIVGGLLGSSSSSQSSSTSSSSIALPERSSSSSSSSVSSNTSSLSYGRSWIVRVATSSLKDVTLREEPRLRNASPNELFVYEFLDR